MIILKAENGFYYTDLSDSDSIDNDDSFEKLYKVDGAMNKMSASDKDNIIRLHGIDEII